MKPAPASGEYAELPAGILWIRLPIPGGLQHINVWLLPDARGWHLVDTGIRSAEVEQAWLALEQRLPLRRDLRSIIITHHHPDHFGMAQWLAERYGVPVRMSASAHAATAASLAGSTGATPERSRQFVRRCGLDPDEAMQRILLGGMYRASVSGEVPADPLVAGELVADGWTAWHVSLHEGHAPGHACLHDSNNGILVSGDQLLPSISSNISLYPSNEQLDPLGQYLESLQALCLLPEDTLVLPSHGLPFNGLHERAAALRAGHSARLQEILQVLVQPAGTQQVADRLFRLERLDALNRLLACTETLAHLRWLELRGIVTRAGEGPAMLWNAARNATGLFATQKP